MDDSLARLRRDVEANPGDVEAVARYEAALLRSGKRDEAKALYRFKFQCPMKYEDMQPGPPWKEHRHCQECDRNVYLVRTAAQLEQRIRAGDCVTCDPAEIGPLLDVLVDDAGVSPARRAEGEPCLIEHDGPLPPPPMPPQRTAGVPMRIDPLPPEVTPISDSSFE